MIILSNKFLFVSRDQICFLVSHKRYQLLVPLLLVNDHIWVPIIVINLASILLLIRFECRHQLSLKQAFPVEALKPWVVNYFICVSI